ncbi:MAG: sigma-70 family RNA polymerase sigma factor [Clostridia bacterium]|nr:sigma-70 family RNA polymerase sigma factor [Clostridia bacterium]
MLVVCLAMIDDENDRLHFERIYHKYEKDVFRRIYRFLKNREDAEDAMQNTWLVVTKNIEFYRNLNDISIRAYILRIARNQAISLYRKRRKEEEMTSDVDLADVSDDSMLIRICDRLDISEIVKCIDDLDRYTVTF